MQGNGKFFSMAKAGNKGWGLTLPFSMQMGQAMPRSMTYRLLALQMWRKMQSDIKNPKRGPAVQDDFKKFTQAVAVCRLPESLERIDCAVVVSRRSPLLQSECSPVMLVTNSTSPGCKNGLDAENLLPTTPFQPVGLNLRTLKKLF